MGENTPKVVIKNIFLECPMVRKEKGRQCRAGLGACAAACAPLLHCSTVQG